MNATTASTLRVVFQIIPATHLFMSGGFITFENGSIAYLRDRYVPLIWDLRDSLNLKLEITFEPSFQYRVAVKHIATGNADIGAMVLPVDSYWKEHGLSSTFVYLPSQGKEHRYAIFQQPGLHYFTAVLFRSFTPSVWITFLIVSISSSILFSFALLKYETSIFTEIFIGWITVSLGKSYFPSQKLVSLKITLFLSFLISLLLSTLIINLYSAEITASFATDDGRLVKSTEDLLKYKYSYCTWYDFPLEKVYPPEFNRKLIANQIQIDIDDKKCSTLPQKFLGLEGNSEKFVYLGMKGAFFSKYAVGDVKQICSISFLKAGIPQQRGMIIRKDSPLRENVSKKLVQFSERGISWRHILSYGRQSDYNCDVDEGTATLTIISMEHILMAHVILAGGMGLSVIIEVIIFIFTSQAKVRVKWG